MRTIKDETGNKYDYWKVLRFHDVYKGNARWLCKCTLCGNTYIRYGFALRAGKTTKCNHCNGKR